MNPSSRPHGSLSSASGVQKPLSYSQRLARLNGNPSLMKALIAGFVTPPQSVKVDPKRGRRIFSDIQKRTQKQEVYAKHILEMTPEDIENASSLYVVKPDVAATYGGWTRFPLPEFHTSDKHFGECTIDIATSNYFEKAKAKANATTPLTLLTEILLDAVKDARTHPYAVYYVMNATNTAEAAKCITNYANDMRQKKYAKSSYQPDPKFDIDPFKDRVEAGEIATHMYSLRAANAGGRRKTKRRQIKKRKTTFKK